MREASDPDILSMGMNSYNPGDHLAPAARNAGKVVEDNVMQPQQDHLMQTSSSDVGTVGS